MNILYILPSLANTAPISIAYHLVDACIKEGFNVEVAYFDNIKGLVFPCHTYQIKMQDVINFEKYDIIHSHMRRPDKYIAMHKKEITCAKTISTIHCDIFEDLKYAYGKTIAYIYTNLWINNLKKFDYTIQVSEFLVKKYNVYFKKNILIHNGVQIYEYNFNNDDYTEIKEKIDEYHLNNYKIILSYSNINKRKGLQQILNTLIYREDLAYICIGNGKELKKLEKKVYNLHLNKRVSFFPFIFAPYNLVPYIDVVVIPSYSESFCLALHEAGMMKARIVCSNIPAFKDAFNELEVCFFELDNTKSLLQAISDALSYNRGINIEKKERRNYTMAIMQNNYISLYKKITEKSNLDE